MAGDEQEIIAVTHPTIADGRTPQVIPAPIVHDDVVAVRHQESFAAVQTCGRGMYCT